MTTISTGTDLGRKLKVKWLDGNSNNRGCPSDLARRTGAGNISKMSDQQKAEESGELECRTQVINQYVRMCRAEPMQAPNSIAECIRRRPIRTVLVAAGIGFLLGRLKKRR